MLLDPSPLSQTVTPSRTPFERGVLYGRPPGADSALLPVRSGSIPGKDKILFTNHKATTVSFCLRYRTAAENSLF